MTKRQSIDGSIKHWERMIEWAKIQPQDKKIQWVKTCLSNGKIVFSENEMTNSINENWYHKYCPLCSKYYCRIPFTEYYCGCKGCPLHINCCMLGNSQWAKVSNSMTWGEWLENANVMLEILKGLKKKDRTKW